MSLPKLPKIGYMNGAASRLNEKVIDGQWLTYLGEYAELVKIPPVALMKLFGGSIHEWHDRFPDSVDYFARGLAQLCEKYGIKILYLNMPFMVPYVLMARDKIDLDLKVVFFAHSIASEYWLKLWIATAPWIKPSDILLCPSGSSKTALLNISGQYRYAHCMPHCLKLDKVKAGKKNKTLNLLSIGRIEDVKNIDLLIRCFAAVKSGMKDVELTIAGEYTGKNRTQIKEYEGLIAKLIRDHQLTSFVKLIGPVFGEAKDECFNNADLLINLSTDPGETFGYNLIEAKMWGLPVVGTCWDGFREVIKHQQDGTFIDCRWDHESPEIDCEQTIDYCVQILKDEQYRENLGLGALKNSSRYNYQDVIPEILKIVVNSPETSNQPDNYRTEMAGTPIHELKEIYHLERLQNLKLQTESPLSILTKDYQDSLPEWMAKVKPIISHYAK